MNKNKIEFADLHVHTTYSDGVNTPEEVIAYAQKIELNAIAITDHDSIDAVNNFDLYKNNLFIFPGVELSTDYKGNDIHILGYLFDKNSEEFNNMLRRYREERNKRGEKILEKLKKNNIIFDQNDIEELLKNNSLGRPHIANLLLKYKYIENFQEAFEKHIGRNCYAYVKKAKLTISEAIKYIKDANGLAILAHPGIYGNIMDEVIKECLKNDSEIKIDGIEVFHPKHSSFVTEKLLKFSKENDLIITGGSDYHDLNDPNHANIGDIKYDFAYSKKQFLRHMEKNKFL